MKTSIIAITLALALSGCSDRNQIEQNNAKIKAYESRFIHLENRISVMEDLLKKTTAANADTVSVLSGKLEVHEKQLDLVTTGFVAVANAVSNLTTKVTTAISNSPSSPVAQRVSQAINTREGIPVSVYNQIAAAAKTEYPNDYEMQAYKIKNQIEAWKKLNR